MTEEASLEASDKKTQRGFLGRFFTLKKGENPHFMLYNSLALGFALGIFPLGVMTLVIGLLWVFMRNFHTFSALVALVIFALSNYLGVPPLHPIGALVLDNGPEDLFVFLATTPLLEHLRLYEYTTMGALVFVAIFKVLTLMASKPLAAKYWPKFEGPGFRASKHFSLTNLILLPLLLLGVFCAALMVAPSMARAAIKSVVAQNLGEDVEVELDEVKISIFDGEVEILGLHVKENEELGGKDVLKLRSAKFEAGFFSLIDGRFEIEQATISGLYIAPASLLRIEEQSARDGSKPFDLAGVELPLALAKHRARISKLVERQEVQDLMAAYDHYQQYQSEKKADNLSDGRVAETATDAQSPKRPFPAYIEKALETRHGPLFVVNAIEVEDVEVSFAGISDFQNADTHYLSSAISISNISSEPERHGLSIEIHGEFHLDTSAERKIKIDATITPFAGANRPMAEVFATGEGFKDLKILGDLESDFPVLSFSLVNAGNNAYHKIVRARLPYQDSVTLKEGFLAFSALYSEKGEFALSLEGNNLPPALVAEGLGDLPFSFDPDTRISFKTIGDDGAFITFGSAKDATALFEIVANDLELGAKKGRKVLGIPSERFCSSFNKVMRAKDGKFDLRVGYRPESGFALEKPGVRSIIYMLLGGFEFSSEGWGEKIFAGANFASIDGKNAHPRFQLMPPKDWDASKDDDGSLAGLTVGTLWKNSRLHPAQQPKKILGLPSSQVVYIWNGMLDKLGGELAFEFQLFDEASDFAPKPLIDFKKLIGDAAGELGVADIFNNAGAFLAALGKDDAKLAKYTAFLSESEKGTPGFGAEDKKAIEKKLGKKIGDEIGKHIDPKKIPKLPKEIPNPFD